MHHKCKTCHKMHEKMEKHKHMQKEMHEKMKDHKAMHKKHKKHEK